MAGIMSQLKAAVKSSGTSRGKILFVGEGKKVRIRFLQELSDGYEFKFHGNWARKINALCLEYLDKECPMCDDEDMKTKTLYAWNVYDVEAKEVKIMLYAVNNCTPVSQLVSMSDAYENTIMDRDYILEKKGSGTSSSYGVVSMDKSKFRNTQVKTYSKKQIIKMLAKAYPYEEDLDMEDEDEDDTPKKKTKKAEKQPEKKSKKKSRDEDEEEEVSGVPVEWLEEQLEANDVDEDEFLEYFEASNLKKIAKKVDKKKAKKMIKDFLENNESDVDDDDEEEWEEDDED